MRGFPRSSVRSICLAASRRHKTRHKIDLARIGMGRKRTAASKGTTYPGVYWYETKGGRLFRCSWVSSNGATVWAYGFGSALDAHKHRSAMFAAADVGQRIPPRQAFAVMFPAWLKSK